MNRLLGNLIYRVQRNPVLVAAFLVAGQALLDGAPVRATVNVLLGVVVRQFTSPAFEVEHRENIAFEIGKAVASTPDVR